MDHYKITEKPNHSLGRTSFLITSSGGIVGAQINGEEHRALAQSICDELNGVKPAPAGEQPRSMSTAPRDGTMIRLLVQFDDHATEDTDGPAWTIGANSYDDTGEDLWQFAGWCWTHDHFTEGKGTPVGWLPMVDDQAVQS